MKLCYTESCEDSAEDFVAGKVNVTLTIDANLLREARVLAAEQGTSVSGLLGDRLDELVRRHKDYDAARRRALSRLRAGYDLQWTAPASRNDLHER
jgi:hypothetical protein